MNLFDLILVQPIFNVLIFIEDIIPGHDFGLALIVFTILVRLIMWPLVRKQLRQTKIMQRLQPELKKIKAKAQGNRVLEAQLMNELYKEKGVNALGSIGLLFVQLPIFLALYSAVRHASLGAKDISHLTYSPLQHLSFVHTIIHDPKQFHQTLFGVVDLTRHAIEAHGAYLPLMLMAILAAFFQYYQSKQLLPKVEEGRKLRDILKEQAAGKKTDSAEMSAIMSNRMSFMFPLFTFIISIYISGALVMYLLTTSIVAVIQQSIVLKQDTEELEKISESTSTKKKELAAKEAEVIEPAKKRSPSKTKRRKR